MNGGFVEFDPAAELHAAHAELLDSLVLLDAQLNVDWPTSALPHVATSTSTAISEQPGLWLLGCSCSRDAAD